MSENCCVKIEKIIYGGESLAKIDDFPFFIENGCPGDFVRIDIVKKNKSYAKAKIKEIIEPSKKRVKPFCPLHNVCGGCGLQHIDYNEQLIQKENIVKETMRKFGLDYIKILPVKAPKINKNYRYKVQYPVSQTKVSKKIIAGYFKKGTHEAVNIKFCPVQPAILDELTDLIRQKAFDLNIEGYNEKNHSGLLRHIIYRVSKYNNNILVILVLNSNKIDSQILKLAEYIKQFKNIVGIVANFNTQKTNVITGKNSKIVIGKDFITEKIGDILYKVSANSFFQVNPESAEIIFNTAKEMIQKNVKNPAILDAYSGVSAFGLQMKNIAKEIICVEECKSSTDDALENIKNNFADNIEVINDDASKTFEDFVKQKKFFDVVLLDPPRKGCTEQSLEYASMLSKNLIIYVSCNPSSLARDLKYLENKNFHAEYIQPVDMFCHTPHIESVVLIRKKV
ncbi:23S rRNA (uracil(1939)-C(5))-methyltransferase RlmD [bacterium]|nr:23S rRNA (uracil(1939)-C(5))-methyltransferase RlmD [bacterium]